MALKRFFLLVNTVRYLAFKQVAYQLYYRLCSLKFDPVSDASCRSSLRWSSPQFSKLSTSDGVEFLFVGVKGRVDNSDWNAAVHSKLWLYNLHYLDDLNAEGIDDQDTLARGLIDGWIKANPPPSGDGWEPYPLSLRIVNLVKWFARQDSLDKRWIVSLSMQMRALNKQIEYHIQGNHLFANAKALVFGGVYLIESDASVWLAKGLKILDQQIKVQFLEDGAHFELSPMYHAIMLWDLCDLINLAERSSFYELKTRLPQWRAAVVRGLLWQKSMLHPDGDISFFNDAAFGIAPTLKDLEIYATKLGDCLPGPDFSKPSALSFVYNKQSGYFVVEFSEGNKAVLDLARIGPDYQPGHAHADTLSFELSLFGCRVFVNSGTSQYGEDLERQRQRSTSAHNTVEVDGENSSEVWAGFRVARRAYPVVEEIITSDEEIFVRAYHTGYRRLKGKNLHRREWAFKKDSCLIIDEVTGFFNSAIARLHVHPDVFFSWDENALVAVLKNGNKLRVVIEGASSVTLQQSTWHPAFGVVIPCQCIVAEFSSGKLMTNIKWSGHV